MKILFDGEIYSLQKNGGINRYFNNLISRLPLTIQPILTSARSINELTVSHPKLKIYSYRAYKFPPRNLLYNIEPIYFQFIESLSKYQIFHPTYYSLLSKHNLNTINRPTVITVYDMIHEQFPDYMDPDGSLRELKYKAVSAADIILCISENTKHDLLDRYPSLESRTRVTYLASDLNASLVLEKNPVSYPPFLFYVGGRGGYKNFRLLLAAFQVISKKQPDIYLYVAGAPFNSGELQEITEKNLDMRIKNFANATDTTLAHLYSNCLAFIYPSLYEGFGIPPLEAMSCRAPVIASNTSSIPEVVGSAALLFDPLSLDDLVEKIQFLIDTPSLRKMLITSGLQQSHKFSWDETVNQTVSSYLNLI